MVSKITRKKCPGPYIKIYEPTTAVVRGGKRSLRARITAREALSNVISRPEVSVCMSVRDAVL